MSQIHITDGQSEKVLDVITAEYITYNNHRQSLKDNLELFEFRTFADQSFSQYLGKHNRVIIPNEDETGYIEFVIHESIKRRSNEGLTQEVYASASYLLLKKAKVIYPTTLANQTTSTAISHAIGGTEWQAGIITKAGTRTFHIEQHTDPFKFLKLIAREFDLELHFRVDVEGNKIIGRYVDLLPRVGQWQGREIELGKDLIGIERVEKTDNIVTKLIGLGPIREDGTRLEVIVEDQEALQRWGRPNPQTGRLQHLIEAYEPQSTREDMTLEELTQYTQTELNKRINAVVEYKSDIADLEHVPGMENKKIRFGDTIKIKDIKFNPPLYLEARVHTQDRSITDKSKKHVELGDFIEYTEDEVKAIWQSLQEQIRQKITHFDLVNYTYDKTTIDGKDESVFQDSTYYADVVALTAQERAKLHAEQKASEAEQNAKQEAKGYTDAEVEAKRQALQIEINKKASEVYVNAELAKKATIEKVNQIEAELRSKAKKAYVDAELVKKATIEKVTQLENDVAKKVDATWVNGQLVLKADNATVQAMNNTVSDLVSASDSLQQRVLENEEALSQQGGQITNVIQEVDTVKGTLNLTIGQLTAIDNTIQSQQTQINANAQAISLKANQADLNTLTNEVSSLSAEIEIQSGKIALKAEQSSLVALESDVTSVSNSLSSLVVNVDGISQNVSNLSQTVNGHTTQISSVNSSITQLSNEISQKVSQAEYTVDKNGIVTRLDSAESTLVQQANMIQQRVTQTTFDTELGKKANQSALNTTNSNLNSLTTRVSNAEAEISVQAGQIQQRVTQTTFNNGISRAEEIAKAMALGNMLWKDPTFREGVNNISRYNNSGGNGVTINRIARGLNAPTTSSHMLEVVVTTDPTSPNHGGFTFIQQSRANAVFIVRFIARLEQGRTLNFHTNSIGGNPRSTWLSTNQGTGKWEEYIHKIECGEGGTFSSTAFYSVVGGTKPFTWHIAYATIFDVTDVDHELRDRVSTAESTITQHANQIASKVSQTEYNADRNGIISRLNSAESTLVQQANMIQQRVTQTTFNTELGKKADQTSLNTTNNNVSALTTRVSNAEAEINVQANQIQQRVTKTEFENLQIGGRNLYPNSGNFTESTRWSGTSVTIKDGFSVLQGIGGTTASGSPISIETNTDYVYSGEIMFSHDVSINQSSPLHSQFIEGSTLHADNGRTRVSSRSVKANEWSKIIIRTNSANATRFRPFIHGLPSGITFWLKNIKLEKGNKATDWTPAPEDIQGQVDQQGTRLSSAESTITQHANQIQQRVTKTEFDNLQIGGRNLIRNTSEEWETPGFASNSAYGVFRNNLNSLYEEEGIIGVHATFSFEAIVETNNGANTASIQFYGLNGTPKYPLSSSVHDAKTNEWTRIERTVFFTQHATNTGQARIEFWGRTPNVTKIRIRKFKLEKGNRATDWTPAPEDVDQSIISVQQFASSIDQKADSIISSVNSLSQTVNGHTTQISSVNSSITQLSNEISQKVSQAEYTVDKNGIVTRLDSAESTLVQQANQIQQRVTQTEVNNSISGALRYPDTRNDNRNPSWYWSNFPRRTIEEFKFRTVIGAPGSSTFGILETVVPWSNSSGGPIIQTFMSNDGNYQRRSTSDTTWSSWIQIETTIGSQAKVDSLNTTEIVPLKTRVSTAESTITQHANQIASKVSQTEYNADRNGIITRLDSAESNITQHANQIQQRVTQTEFNSGLAGKEDTVFKQNSAPPHLNGRLWLNTSVTPNVLNRSTGSAWVRATPTTANEVGAYSATDGNALASRISTAESTITQHANAINLRATKTELNTEKGRIDEAFGQLSVQAGQISQRVEKNGVIAAINLSPESVDISANRINFNGAVFGSNATFTGRIEGGRITSNTTIDVTTDLRVGNNINIGLASDNSRKIIRFNNLASFVCDGTKLQVNVDDFILNADVFNLGNTLLSSPSGTLVLGSMSVSGGLTVNNGFVNADALDTNSTHIYTRTASNGELRVTVRGTTTNYRAIRCAGMETGYTNLFLSCATTGEVRVTSDGRDTWGNANYRPIRASSFPTGTSLRENKKDIEVFVEDALSVIKNSKTYLYRLKEDQEEKQKQLGLMVDETPRVLHGEAGDSMEMYAVNTFLWRGVQQLAEKTEYHDNEINWLKVENQSLRSEVRKLKDRVRNLELKIA